jgi:glycosyltransferase 2 family protein
MHSRVRRTAISIAKIALALAILVYLTLQARDGFARLSEQTFAWHFLVAALLFSLLTAMLSFARWHLLIRAVGISAPLVDTLRLGALGFALNFVSPGSVGGDLFKAVFLAHRHPGQRPEAVATVLADRALGLLVMLSVASCGILATDVLNTDSTWLHALAQSILTVTGVGWLIFALLMCVGTLSGRWMTEQAAGLPFVGSMFARLLNTVHIYRGKKRMLTAAFALSALMALSSITTFYLISRGLGIPGPPWSEHVVIVPMAGVAGAVPLTPSGLGTMEFAVEELYRAMPGGEHVVQGDGTLVALGRRVTDIAVALIGLGFYFAHRREVRQVIAEAEVVADHLE